MDRYPHFTSLTTYHGNTTRDAYMHSEHQSYVTRNLSSPSIYEIQFTTQLIPKNGYYQFLSRPKPMYYPQIDPRYEISFVYENVLKDDIRLYTDAYHSKIEFDNFWYKLPFNELDTFIDFFDKYQSPNNLRVIEHRNGFIELVYQLQIYDTYKTYEHYSNQLTGQVLDGGESPMPASGDK